MHLEVLKEVRNYCQWVAKNRKGKSKNYYCFAFLLNNKKKLSKFQTDKIIFY